MSPEELANAPGRLQFPTSGSKVIWYCVKKYKNDVLLLLKKFREEDFELRHEKGFLAEAIYNFQPRITFCTSKSGFKDQEHLLRNLAFPSCLPSEAPATQKDALKFMNDIYRIRREEWNRRALPGMLTVPASFTLLPTFKV